MKLKALAAGLAIPLGLSCVGVPTAEADVVYSYKGNNFTTVGGAYTTTNSLSGSFDLASPLSDNLFEQDIFPTSFSFSDGVQTITESGPTAATSYYFIFSTNATGAITHWAIDMVASNNVDEITSYSLGTIIFDYGGSTFISDDSFGMSLDPGTWTAATAVPEPSSIYLLGFGLLGLAFMWRRKPLGLHQ